VTHDFPRIIPVTEGSAQPTLLAAECSEMMPHPPEMASAPSNEAASSPWYFPDVPLADNCDWQRCKNPAFSEMRLSPRRAQHDGTRGSRNAAAALALALTVGTCGALHVPQGRASLLGPPCSDAWLEGATLHGAVGRMGLGFSRACIDSPMEGSRKGGGHHEGKDEAHVTACGAIMDLRGGGSSIQQPPPPPPPGVPSADAGSSWWEKSFNLRRNKKRRKSFPVRQRLWASFSDVVTALAALEQAPGSLMRSTKEKEDAMFLRQLLNGFLPVMAYATTSIYMVISQAYVLRNKNVKKGINYSTMLLLYQNICGILIYFPAKFAGWQTFSFYNHKDSMVMLPNSALFAVMVYSSAQAIRCLQVPMMSVLKNFAPITITLVEWLLMKGPRPSEKV